MALNGKKIPTLYDLFHKDPLAGKGVSKKDDIPRNFKNFFKLSWWHLSNIVSVNLMFLLGNFPMLFLLLGFSGLLSDTISSPGSPMFATLFGTLQETADPVKAALFGVHGVQGVMSVPTVATTVVYCIGALVILTWGPTNVGTTYILRNMIKGDPIFVWHDFFYAIKRNLRQSLIMGVLDLLFTGVLLYDALLFYYNLGTYTTGLWFYMIIAFIIIYTMMRFYIYNIMITFDLSIFKILKNSLIFTAVGLKRNILALLGIVLLGAIDYYLMIVMLPLGVMLPLILLYGYGAYMGTYASWPKIKEIMIDPYKTDEPEEEISDEEVIFRDDVK